MNDTGKISINAFLRKKRIESGLSQRKLAKKSGVCINTIGNFERNLSVPRLKTVVRISNVLEVEMADLVNECEL